MPFTDEDYRRMGEIADASVVDAMTKLAGLLSNEDFKAKLLDHDNLETDPDFEWKIGRREQPPRLPARRRRVAASTPLRLTRREGGKRTARLECVRNVEWSEPDSRVRTIFCRWASETGDNHVQ